MLGKASRGSSIMRIISSKDGCWFIAPDYLATHDCSDGLALKLPPVKGVIF
jgi:hypothetical protein